MPSGYTSLLADNKLSFKDFALLCTRAFGVAISMRDDPISKPVPEKFEPDDYHYKEMIRYTNKVKELESLKRKEAIDWAKNEIKIRMQEIESCSKDDTSKQNLDHYKKILAEAKAWEPAEDFLELKKFMISQIEETIKWDCSYKNDYYKEEIDKLNDLDPFEYYKSRIESYKKDILYHSKQWTEELERIDRNNKWLKELREELA